MTLTAPRLFTPVRRLVLLHLVLLLPVSSLRADGAELRWPPAGATGWDDGTEAELKPVFDAYSAMSAELLTAHREHGAEGTDALVEVLKGIVERHPEMREPLPQKLYLPYVNHVSLQYRLMSASVVEKPGVQKLAESQLATAIKLAANNPELWVFESMLQGYRGHWDEARSALAMAKTLAIFRTGELDYAKLLRLEAMQALPAEVRDVPQHDEIDYNVSVLRQNAMLGKAYGEEQIKMAAALYGNLGARLAVAWQRADAPEVVAEVFRAHASLLKFVAYPDSIYEPLRARLKQAEDLRGSDPAAALALVTEVATIAPLPNVLALRGTVLGKMERWDDALADLGGAILMAPDFKFAVELAESYKRESDAVKAVERERIRTQADALIAEARAAFRAGDETTAMAKVEAALEVIPFEPQAVILKTNWLSGQNRTAEALTLLDGAFVAQPDSPELNAIKIFGRIGARDLEGLSVEANLKASAHPKNASIQAAAAMATFMSTMSSGRGEIGAESAQALKKVDEALRLDPKSVIAYTVRAQLRMMTGNRDGAMEDMVALVDASDYAPPMMLQQVAAMLTQMGKTAEAAAVLARMPK